MSAVRHDGFADLDFTVDRPICSEALEYDGAFLCPRCQVLWPRSGYGHEAESQRADSGLCEAQHPGTAPHWAWEDEFCWLDAGHKGDHQIDPGRTTGGPITWSTACPDADEQGEGAR